MLTRRSLTKFPSLTAHGNFTKNLQPGCCALKEWRRACSRGYQSSSTEQKQPSDSDSIFSRRTSAWDHVFDGIKDVPPPLPASARGHKRTLANSDASKPALGRRRQTMTAREISAFDDMFNMIFNAVTEHKAEGRMEPGAPDDVAIGSVGTRPKARKEISDLFGTLRKHSKRLKWTTASDEELDRKKEEMELCDTDQQLLEWAMREVFGESKKYEEAARNAVDQVAKGEHVESMPMLQHPAYPHLISLLMLTFRDKYHDPHLALSIFDYARHLSIPSYVFGCTAPAYNELIETRWKCFRDLKGILEALEEMKVNAVEPDNRTRKLVEIVRREAAGQGVWEEEGQLGTGGQVWNILNQIEALVAKPQSNSPRKQVKPQQGDRKQGKKLNAWKSKSSNESDGDDWQFGRWEEAPEQSESWR